MRIGGRTSFGNQHLAVPNSSSGMRTVPASDRLCDAVVLAFALWTVCSHAVVAAGRGLWALMLLYAVMLTAGLWVWSRLGAESPLPDAGGPVAPAETPHRVLRAVAVVAATAVAWSFAMRPDVLQLWWSAVILLGLAAVAVCFGTAPRIAPPERSRLSEGLLWLLAGAAVVVTLISHRPDTDDSFYVNVAVAAADVPSRALLSVDTMHGIPGLPLHLTVYRVNSYELLNGALSYLTGMPALYAFHWLSASFAAVLVPFAHAKLFRILAPSRWLPTVATLIFVLVAAGETHRWYGNFSFVRMWQGKAVFLYVFMPLVYVYALRFALRPNLRDWTKLGAAQIAAVGCTSSALWVAPAGAVMALCSAIRPSGRGLKTILLGALASSYVLGAAWVTKASLKGRFALEPSSGDGGAALSGPLLSDALTTVLGDSRLLIFGIVTLLCGWVFAATGLARRFAIVFPLVVFLGLLNPYIAAWVPAYVTGPSYWRCMWALPLPIVMALMLTSPLHLGGPSWPGTRRAAWLVLLAVFALVIPKFGGLSSENWVQLTWPKLKVYDAAYRWAVAVNESVPPGSYVAVPSAVDVWLVTLHHHVYPLTVSHHLRDSPNALSRDDLFRRMDMRRFLDSPELVEATPQQFRDGLDRFEVRAVCLVSSPKAGAARAILEQAGFRQTLRDEDYELWVRPDPVARVRPDGENR